MLVEDVAEVHSFDWDRLLREIRREQVVPIIGPELLPYHRSLASKLAAELAVTESAATSDIRAVADAYLRKHGDVRPVEDKLEGLLEKYDDIPDVLRQLVEIEQFRLFVTTDYASLLESAMSLREPSETCSTLAFAQRREFEDLDVYPKAERCVYHLLGHFRTQGTVALARVDQLEYFYDLQTEKGPRGLLQILAARRNLLFLGCDFPEWLAGFFTRILVGKPLYETRQRGIEVIANESVLKPEAVSSPLTAFLRANRVEVYSGDAQHFIRELVKRYKPPPPERSAERARVSSIITRRGYSFISYSRADRDYVKTLVSQLRAKQVEVWFDDTNITPGDALDGDIRLAICEDSSAFVPVLSKNALEVDEKYFVQEWRWSLQEKSRKFDDVKFIFPVIVDDLDRDTAVTQLKRRFPEFAGLHIEICPAGVLQDDRLAEELRSARKRYERSARRR